MMPPELADRLIRFSESLHADEFFSMATETFFKDFCAETGCETFQEIREKIGDYAWAHIFPCLMEFFFSNDYALTSPDGQDINWNAIDCFLETEGRDVSAEERKYLESLRDSHLSLFRVVKTGPGENIQFHDLIARKDVKVKGRGDMAARAESGQVFGLRIVKTGKTLTIGGGILPFAPEGAEEFADDLRDLLEQVIKAAPLAPDIRAGEAPLTDRDLQHLTRVMLAPEIATVFMFDSMEQKMLEDMMRLAAKCGPKRRKKSADPGKPRKET